ncbi:chromate transporter [Bacillus shivajii]|uniref:chromate transporter n=1 Tax=Bacillus shivajii TaxID=1983719 RepID=UPI001CF9C4CE|nr:chromate transporter [Bacillus shivajii]UCZ52489.1 chromate transporter [Bacillus shivajii]
MAKQKCTLKDLFFVFLRIGPATFGGGYAMIPMIEREVVEKKKWLNINDVSDVFAMAESVPGAIAINSATFIGHRIRGIAGAITALLGVLIPTFGTVLMLSLLYFSFRDHQFMELFFEGVRPAIVALIVYAGVKISKTALIDSFTVALFAAILLLLLFSGLHPIIFIIIGGVIGYLKLGKK